MKLTKEQITIISDYIDYCGINEIDIKLELAAVDTRNEVNIQNAQVFLGGPADLMEQEGDAFDAKQVVAEQ